MCCVASVECELVPPHPRWDGHESLGGQQTSRSPATHSPSSLGSKEQGTAQPASPRPSPAAQDQGLPPIPQQGGYRAETLLLTIKHDWALPLCHRVGTRSSVLVPVPTVWASSEHKTQAQKPGDCRSSTSYPVTLQTRQRMRPGALCESSETQAGPPTFPGHALC